MARTRPGVADEELLIAPDIERESAEGGVLGGFRGEGPVEGDPEGAGGGERGGKAARGGIGADRDAAGDIGGRGPRIAEAGAAVLGVESAIGIAEGFRDEDLGV